ncbi:MAG: Sua5/YciO/YrdC/YwlC family protein [Gemmataceae bacterium]
MADILTWRDDHDAAEIIQRTATAVLEGAVVAVPTETGYVAAGSVLAPTAVARLAAGTDEPLTLAVPTVGHALDWVWDMSTLGRRLARRCWPGPMTLVFANGVGEGLLSRLPTAVRRHLCPDSKLYLTSPEQVILASLLRFLPAPMVLARRAAAPGETPSSLEMVLQACGADIALAIDAGPPVYDQPNTVVAVNGTSWRMVSEGVLSTEEVAQQTVCLVVFVCTGNTCRSPMAEALCKMLLARRLQCTIEELPQRGFLVLSAGMAAAVGDQAAPEAAAAVQELGAELTGHASRPLAGELAAQADFLITMTRGHGEAVRARFPHVAPPRLLCPDGHDIADPIGGDADVYRACAQQLLRHIEQLVAELQ